MSRALRRGAVEPPVVGRRRVGLAAALTAVLVAVGCSSPPSAPSSRDAKTTCVYVGSSITGLASFASLTGQPANCALVYNDSSTTWNQWADPWFTQPKYGWQPWLQADPADRRVVISQEMIPDQVPSNWRELGAAGAYDGYARELATNLVAAGMGNAVIRLGHEMNGNWYHDDLGNNPAQYGVWAAYWARIVRVMRLVPGAHFLFDWNVSAGIQTPLASYYPGNNVVDVIGIDIYDSGMPGDPTDPSARWESLESEPGGLAQIVAFAREHGKPLSFPEWGVVNTANGGLGDDPAFVKGIATVVKDNDVLYQSYFDRATGAVVPLAEAPQSLRTWEEYFGPHGAINGHPW
jgi:hypothetical protein